MKYLFIALCALCSIGTIGILRANAQTCNPFGYNSECSSSPSIPTSSSPSTPTASSTSSSSTSDSSSTTSTPNPSSSVAPSASATITPIVHIIPKITSLPQAVVVLRAVAQKEQTAATTIATVTLASSVPFVATNVFPPIVQLGQFFGSFFSLYRKKERWGTVVDSDLGKPVAHAVVQLFDSSNQLKETQVTGASGQFGFILPVGKYYIVVDDPGFVFPAHKRPSLSLREGERIYLGEEFEITEREAGKIPHIIIPMDRKEKVPPGNAVLQRYMSQIVDVLSQVSFGLLFIGSAVNTYFFILTPGRLYALFEVLYLIMLILKLIILLFHQRGIGTVIDRTSRALLDLAVIRLYDAKTNRIVQTKVTNKKGGFFILAARGEYTVSVSKPGYKTLLIDKLHIKGQPSKAIALNFALEPLK